MGKKITIKNNCTGCALCSYICPSKCIQMKEGELGHLFPSIDHQKCINCNLCVKNCPSNKTIKLDYPMKAYAAWSKDENDYITSTSGGAASVFSEEIIRRGGVVYGCSLTNNSIVKHVRIDNSEQLFTLKGSKYVQSDIKDIYGTLKSDVKQGIPTLFIGTPCQVGAIKSIYPNPPSNLYLVDIVCHGVPSQKLFQEYLKSKFGKTNIKHISFRKGSELIIEIKDKDRIIYSVPYRDDLYYSLFMQGFTYRESCHQCKYAQPNRTSDITIGDFWGLGKNGKCDIPEHKYGISVILPITEKGISLIECVKDKLYIYERPIEEAVQGNAQLKSPSQAGKRIRIFQWLEPLLGIEKAYKLAHTDVILKKCFR